MAQEFPKTAYGLIRPATAEEIARERIGEPIFLLVDSGLNLLTDSGVPLKINSGVGYTNPNLHRRIDNEAQATPGSHYTLAVYNKEGVPYRQSVKIGVWDGINSYRTTETFIHDEESTTCEIP